MSAGNAAVRPPRASMAARGGRTRQSIWRKSWVRFSPPAALLLVLLVLWQAIVDFAVIPPSLLPSPIRVALAGWRDRDSIAVAAGVSLQETLAGLVLGIAAALVIAVLVDGSSAFRRSVYPLIVGSQTVPVVAIAPLVVLWFGFGILPKILLVALYTFFPIAIAVIAGIAQAPRESIDLMRTLGVSRWRVLLTVKLPSAAPNFFSGLRIAASYALGTAVVAEFLGSFDGLGIYLISAKSSFRIDLVFAASFVIVALTLILFSLIVVIEHYALPWRRYERGSK